MTFESPFLAIPPERILAENSLAFAFFDGFPVSPGHALIVTRRVVPTFFECTPAEQAALMALVGVVKALLDARYHPDGYNVGFNAGPAAGQTVPHVHIHVIPRYAGDMPDPRGGVRHVIPWKANYLLKNTLGEKSTPAHALVTGGADGLIDHLAPLFGKADHIAILAAFAQRRGVELLRPALVAAAQRGATVQILTGDYRAITEAEALSALLALADGHPGIEARLLHMADLPGAVRIFHAKSWRIEGPGFGVAWVGSSNLSAAALTQSVEWNLRLDRRENPDAFTKLQQEYAQLWALARPLTVELVARYATAAPPQTSPPWPDADVVPLLSHVAAPEAPYGHVPTPHPVQAEALTALKALRRAGRRRALVVLATGLGKTWLAAFDWRARRVELGRTPRLLFLAHRQELLMQAEAVFTQILAGEPERPEIGRHYGEADGLDATLVFASVAKLARHRRRLPAFDYVIVDEVHHATARSYRRILDGLEAGFLLGLTATPDRADAADVAALFDDCIAYQANIGRGIEIKRLVPFSYLGIKDTIDYQQVPWRNGEFDTAVLERHAMEQARMDALWQVWSKAERTLVFCCTVRHAEAVQRWLSAQGVAVRCVHSGPNSDDRRGALSDLAAGRIEAICAVDLFNEGIDVPTVDRVILLRPTGSPVVFLQQLGRGLRAAPGKERLQVLDFVGNHRVFLGRLRTLIAAGGGDPTQLAALVQKQEIKLLYGCDLTLTLEAKAAMEALAAVPVTIQQRYLALRERDGERPFAAEIVAEGFSLSGLQPMGGWFGLVAAQGDLSTEEHAAYTAHAEWLGELERTPMTKSFKIILIEALVELCSTSEDWFRGVPIEALAVKSFERLQARSELFTEVHSDVSFPDLSDAAHRRAWVRYWSNNPIAAWCRSRWFRISDDRFRPTWFDDAHYDAFRELTREIVDARRIVYLRRSRNSTDGFVCKVIHSNGRPILMLPAPRPEVLGAGRKELPVRLPNGEQWVFHFVKIACNVAGPPDAAQSQLGTLLQQWFGDTAGQPGTTFAVRFYTTPTGWWVEST